LPACTIALEACGSAHYWARQFRQYGHEVRLLAPQFVKPSVKSNKNDAADAEGHAQARNLMTIPGIGAKAATAFAGGTRRGADVAEERSRLGGLARTGAAPALHGRARSPARHQPAPLTLRK
jgi:transposase